jgi:hypothetical protein
LAVYECKRLRLVSKPGENERDFRIRVAEALRSDRDERVDGLRARYAARLTTLEDRIRRAEAAVAREQDQANNQRVQTAVSLGATLLGAFLGRKAVSQSTLGRATTTVRGAGRAAKEQRDVALAREGVAALRARHAGLAAELEREIRDLASGAETVVTRTLRPRKSDIEVRRVGLLWRPA